MTLTKIQEIEQELRHEDTLNPEDIEYLKQHKEEVIEIGNTKLLELIGLKEPHKELDIKWLKVLY